MKINMKHRFVCHIVIYLERQRDAFIVTPDSQFCAVTVGIFMTIFAGVGEVVVVVVVAGPSRPKSIGDIVVALESLTNCCHLASWRDAVESAG